MKRILLLAFVSMFLMPLASLVTAQDDPEPFLEITGVNSTQLPSVTITANVFDSLSQPVGGLTIDDFQLFGNLAASATITEVQNITADNLPFAVVLAIDTSSSMAGPPIEEAKAAARQFVNSIGPDDPVAIVSFGTEARLVQDYTSDKATLLRAIDALGFGGQTALYDAGFTAVQKAFEAPTPRRAVILLSDGAEFGGVSANERNAALDEARIRGVPVYTIGLGYGFDRTYLLQLSRGTNARNFESPNADQLSAVYADLASLLRTQYVLTLSADVPGDGREYAFALEAMTPDGVARAEGVMRAPIFAPIITLPDLTDPIEFPTLVTATVRSDDPLAGGEYLIDGGSVAQLTAEPFSYVIDPVALLPGQHEISFTATDTDGDSTSISAIFEVAALAPDVEVRSNLGQGPVTTAETVTVIAGGQTPITTLSYSFAPPGTPSLSAASVDDPLFPHEFVIDPGQIVPDEYELQIVVTNSSDVSTTVLQNFVVPALPAELSVSGLDAGQVLDSSTEVRVDLLSSQTRITDLTFSIDGEPVTDQGRAPGALILEAIDLAPGDHTLTIRVFEESEQVTTRDIPFVVAAIAPQVNIASLIPGETLEDDRTIEVEISSQTPVLRVIYRLDGIDLAVQPEAPFVLDLSLIELGPGPHILTVEVVNEAQRLATVDIPFLVSETPFVALTEVAAEATAAAESTAAAGEAAQAQATAEALATEEVIATEEVQPTEEGISTEEAQATLDVLNAQATEQMQATAEALASEEAISTEEAQATLDALNAQATAAFQATAEALASEEAISTEDAQSTLNAIATTNALATREAGLAVAARATTAADIATEAAGVAQAQVEATAEALATIEVDVAAQAAQRATDSVQATASAEEAAATQQATSPADATAQTDPVQPTDEPAATEVAPTAASTDTAPDTEASETPEAVAVASDTPGPTPTLIPVDQTGEPESSNIVPIVVVIVIVIVILGVIFGALRGGRRRN